jgi:hypothetical protein
VNHLHDVDLSDSTELVLRDAPGGEEDRERGVTHSHGSTAAHGSALMVAGYADLAAAPSAKELRFPKPLAREAVFRADSLLRPPRAA